MAKATKKTKEAEVAKSPEQLENERKSECLQKINQILSEYRYALIPTFNIVDVPKKDESENTENQENPRTGSAG